MITFKITNTETNFATLTQEKIGISLNPVSHQKGLQETPFPNSTLNG